MNKVDRIVLEMSRNPSGVRFADLARVCKHYFGEPRTTGGSRQVHRTPLPGDPRANIQDFHGTAKLYQVKQVLAAIERLTGKSG